MKQSFFWLSSLLLASAASLGCSGTIGVSEGAGDGDPSYQHPPFRPPGPPSDLAGLFDDKYFDGHVHKGEPTPVLPPGKWDWNDAKSDLLNWSNFEDSIGRFNPLEDDEGRVVGWTLAPNTPGAVNFSGAAAYFEGSSGADILDLGARGQIHSNVGSLGGGPDVLIFNEAWALDFSTSSATCDASQDNDLVVAGCDINADASFDIQAATIHTGRGSDLIFARDTERAAYDLGNLGETTSLLDPEDGDDVAVLRGNMLDFRFFGGVGDDTAVWYVDEVHQKNPILSPNFFGGGGAGGAVWGDSGKDRLVLVIPSDTQLISSPPTLPGQLLVHIHKGYAGAPVWDGPTNKDPRARYCITCGVSPSGERTLTLEYRSKDDHVRTGYFFVTAFEELQVGVGEGAALYTLDNKKGWISRDPSMKPFTPPALDPAYCHGGKFVDSGALP